MSGKKKPYDDPDNWEYDGGPDNFKGEIASPYINMVLDRENYLLVLRQYGTEGAKAQAISMCLAQGRP
jgi:hypothetical protein